MSHHSGTDFLGEYIQRARLHGQATLAGDSAQANKHHARLERLYRELSAQGPEAQRKLLALLEHEDVAVRCWAAAHALNFAPERGEPVLREVAERGPVPLCMTAETVLAAWRSGTL